MARGSLRIYLGAAPGVGKTFAMLDEGYRRRARGTDVVIGYVETHGRPRTIEQLRDLELVPRARLEHRGQIFEEMDVDAVLARCPDVALVDELAHTNVPGSRNEKRWQDVEELLAAGIDVITTVNVQHLESLNDVVETITDVRQRETVPDVFVRSADQVELVDMTPEALRRRMAHGNIYAADKIDAALANFFRPGNLGALRELALLWMADKVEDALREYRTRHQISRGWETRERVAVAVTGAPGADNLIRRAARMARRLRAELIGIHVVAGDGLTRRAGPHLADDLALLEELGGRFVEVVGDDVAVAIVQTARAENATQIVIGASRRSRLDELRRGSVVNRVVRLASKGVDVHVIATGAEEAPARAVGGLPSRLRPAPVSRRRHTVALAGAAVALPLLTWVLTTLHRDVGLESDVELYLLVVVLVAAVGGLWPALVASIGSFLLLNYFFAPPTHTFTIANGRDVLALVVFLVVTVVVSALVDVTVRRRADAARAQSDARAFAAMAATVLQDPDPVPALVAQLASAFAVDGVSVLAREQAEGAWRTVTAAGASPPADPGAATFALELGDGTVLALDAEHVRADDRELLGGFANQLGVALRATRLAAAAGEAEALALGNELRNALLAAVSHDLRTPLASIRAAATSLLSDDVEWDRDASREMLAMIDEESERLNRIVANLLDMSRLQTGAVALRPQDVGLEEVVAGALLGLHLPGGRVQVHIDESLPPVHADPDLLERAIANLVDNAARHAPESTAVDISATASGDALVLRVADRGPGIPAPHRDAVFAPFQRLGDQPRGQGVGLGLAVAKGFVEVSGGSIAVEDTPGGGCTVLVTLPAAPPVAR